MLIGDISKLGAAERFIFQLIRIAHYNLRIQGMQLKLMIESSMVYIKSMVEKIDAAGKAGVVTS